MNEWVGNRDQTEGKILCSTGDCEICERTGLRARATKMMMTIIIRISFTLKNNGENEKINLYFMKRNPQEVQCWNGSFLLIKDSLAIWSATPRVWPSSSSSNTVFGAPAIASRVLTITCIKMMKNVSV